MFRNSSIHQITDKILFIVVTIYGIGWKVDENVERT